MAEGVPTREGGQPIEENPKTEMQICDVCRFVDGNVALQQCSFCGGCKAWVCDKDAWHYPRRAKAATIKAARTVKGWVHPDDKDPGRPKDAKLASR